MSCFASAIPLAAYHEIEVKGVKYAVVAATYQGSDTVHVGGILPAGETTRPSLLQMFLDSTADNEDIEALGATYDVIVVSQAVQTAGFGDFIGNVAFGGGYKGDQENVAINGGSFSGNVGRYLADDGWESLLNDKVTPTQKVAVNSADGLKNAIAAGKKDIIVVDAVLNEKIKLGYDVNASFMDCTITGNNAWGYVNNATFANCTFDSGSDNASMHFDQLFGDLVVENCTFTSGKVQIGTDGSSSATFNNCVFGKTETTSIWAEKGMRFYSPTAFNNCEFNNRVVLAGSNDLSLTFNNCTMEGGKPVYYKDNTDGIIRGGNIPDVTIK